MEKAAIDGREIPLSQVAWELESQSRSPESATFSLDIVDANKRPVLRLTRSYLLESQPLDAKRYDLQVDLSVQNLDDQPHEVVV
ncbi:MAG: hypothetical protein GTO03_07865, partial [Planctomycetales bacterium]|nr:hypothetical protein [Planctomycetales bacterium]